MTLIPLLSLWGSPAYALGFRARTMRAPLSALEVERPLVLGKGWLELGLSFDDHLASGEWSPTGGAIQWEYTRWTYTTERVGLRYGTGRRSELSFTVPFHYVRLTNAVLGTDASTVGLGDAGFGWRQEWLRRDAPVRSVLTDLSFEVPSGVEAPGSVIGGRNTAGALVLSNGTLATGLAIRGKQQVGAFSCTAGVGYTRRWSANTEFDVEMEGTRFPGRFKPGDVVAASVQPLLQIGPVAAAGELRFAWRQAARTGTATGGLLPDAPLEPIEGSDGWSLVVSPSLTLDVSRGVDLVAAASVPLRGEDLSFFPLEALTPTRGVTWSGAMKLRY